MRLAVRTALTLACLSLAMGGGKLSAGHHMGFGAGAFHGTSALDCVGHMHDGGCHCATHCAHGSAWQAIGGIEATYLYPRFRGKHDLLIEESFENEVVVTDTLLSQDEFDYGFAGAPRVWLGAENASGGGFRGRYWQYKNSDNFYSLEPLLIFDGDSHLDAFTVDLEGTRRFGFAAADILASLGVRHASITHDESIGFNEAFAWGHAGMSRRTYGTGITGAAEGRRAIGTSNFALFGNTRGSVLWGNTSANARAGVSTDVAAVGVVAQDRQSDRLYIIESQTGLEWSRYLRFCHGQVFARAAFEYQRWSSENNGFALADTGDIGLSALARTHSTRNEFYGATFAIGLSR